LQLAFSLFFMTLLRNNLMPELIRTNVKFSGPTEVRSRSRSRSSEVRSGASNRPVGALSWAS